MIQCWEMLQEVTWKRWRYLWACNSWIQVLPAEWYIRSLILKYFAHSSLEGKTIGDKTELYPKNETITKTIRLKKLISSEQIEVRSKNFAKLPTIRESDSMTIVRLP